MGKPFELLIYLDLDPIMPNIELVRAILIYYNVLNFMFLDRFLFGLKNTETQKQTHTHTHKHTGTHRQTLMSRPTQNATTSIL